MAADTPRNLTQTTLRGGAWLSLAAVLQVLLQLLTVGILARLLSPREFGLVAAAMVVLELSQGFALLGMKPAIVQRAELSHQDLRAAHTIAVGLSTLLGVLVFALAAPFARLLNTPSAAPMVQVLSLVFLVQSQSAVAEGLAARRQQFGLLALRRTLSYFVGYGVIGVGLAVLGFGAWALVGAKLGEVTVAAILLSFGCRHPRRPLFERERLRQLFHFGTGFSVSQIANTLANQADYFVVARVLGPASLGLYSRSYQIMRLPARLLGNIVEDAAFPGFSAVQNERARLARGLFRSLLLMNTLLFLAAVACAVLAPEIIAIALGPQWSAAAPLLALFALALPFRSSQRLATTVSRSTGANWRIASGEALYFATVLSGAYLGSRHGLDGVVWGVTAAILVQTVVQLELARRLSGLPFALLVKAHVLPLPLTLVFGLTLWTITGELRTWSGSPLVVLIGSILLAGCVVTAAIAIRTSLFLPADIRPIFDKLVQRIPVATAFRPRPSSPH
ncbi:lipopolysaccharide biosynthesis protein [Novosphingobium aquimarinum]|uniref:lipopolysaccharide biosynthesis protein n=1 Tax=Novosphingobium aquimarinum TaxID=2682494 RepID=UPI0012EBDED6|nr:lipopolysaccharide biosynthesis protein [Novosphingobium aquimarinum]